MSASVVHNANAEADRMSEVRVMRGAANAMTQRPRPTPKREVIRCRNQRMTAKTAALCNAAFRGPADGQRITPTLAGWTSASHPE